MPGRADIGPIKLPGGHDIDPIVLPGGHDMDTTELPETLDIDPMDLSVSPVTLKAPELSKNAQFIYEESLKMNKNVMPSIVTSGYNLEQLKCTVCIIIFKDCETLINHMLEHFKPRPRPTLKHVNRNKVGCPICGKTLQRSSYARHVKTHGTNVKEVPPCKLNIGSKFITQENLETRYERLITYGKEKQKDDKKECKDNGNVMTLSNLNETSVSFDNTTLIAKFQNPKMTLL